MSRTLRRRESEAAWELRTEWARRREVVLTIGGPRRRKLDRLRGYVEHVAATDAFVLLWDGDGLVHVPCSYVRAVRAPHWHEDGDEPVRAPPPRPILAPMIAGQLELPLEDRRAVIEEHLAGRVARQAARARRGDTPG